MILFYETFEPEFCMYEYFSTPKLFTFLEVHSSQDKTKVLLIQEDGYREQNPNANSIYFQNHLFVYLADYLFVVLESRQENNF
jgi:hypothetical protein